MQTNFSTFRPNLKGVIVEKSIFNEEENKYIFYGIREDIRPTCKNEDCDYSNHHMNIKDYRYVTIKMVPYDDSAVIGIIKKQRYICPKCKKIITSEIDNVDKHCTISNDVKKSAIRRLKDMKAFKQVGKELNVSSPSILRVFRTYERPEEEYNYKVIFIDEFKGNADGEKYQLAIYDKNKKLICILKNRLQSSLEEFLKEHKSFINLVITDMFNPFRTAIKKVLPKASIIADKFHVIRQSVWMLRNVRIRLFNESSAETKEYKGYKKYWKLISKSPISEMTEAQKKRIDKLKELDERFKIAYDLNKEFFEMFELTSIKEFKKRLNNLIINLKNTEIKECIELSKTLLNWEKEIINIIKYEYNNGFVEGINNKIKVIKRVSFGIKKFENLQKLIYLRVS